MYFLSVILKLEYIGNNTYMVTIINGPIPKKFVYIDGPLSQTTNMARR